MFYLHCKGILTKGTGRLGTINLLLRKLQKVKDLNILLIHGGLYYKHIMTIIIRDACTINIINKRK